jgi:S1-C subfamily serine protease
MLFLALLVGTLSIDSSPANAGRHALPVPIPPSAARLDTVPADSGRAPAGGYTGIRSGYRQTARIVGNTVVAPTDPVVLVISVARDSPAERAGLAAGDVLLEIEGVSVRSDTVLARLVPGVSYPLRILRGRDEIEVTLVPGPPQPAAPRRAVP